MIKDQLAKFIIRHWNKVKIFWILFALVVMIVATKTYLNYNTIIESIDDVKYDIKSVEDEIAYSKNFLEKYLDSEYADYFLAHKNNVLFNWEYIIRFKYPQENKEDEKKSENNNIIQTPKQSWNHFIKSKLK